MKHFHLCLAVLVMAVLDIGAVTAAQYGAPTTSGQTFVDALGKQTTVTFQLPNMGNPDNLLTFQSNSSNGNTIAARNINNGGYSAYVLRDMFGNEVGAIHSDNTFEGVITGSITGSVLTVTSVATGGSVQIGATVVGVGTPTAAGTYVMSNGTGTGGTGTYNLNNSQTIPSETMNLMVGGMNYESSSLFNNANPSAVPAPVSFRQSWQQGTSGGLTFRNFLTIDYLSNIHLAPAAPCNGSGQIQDTMQIDRAGFVGICAGTQPATGVSFGVGWGGSFFSRTNVGGAVAAGADVTIANATTPDLKFNIPTGHGWTMDIILNSSPFRLDFQDTTGGTLLVPLVPFSIGLNGDDYVTIGGTERHTAAVRTVPTTGGTVTFGAHQSLAILDPAGTLATQTVQLPACTSTNDGDERSFLTTQALTALSVTTASGSSVANGSATSAAAGDGHTYHCLGSNTTWYQRT